MRTALPRKALVAVWVTASGLALGPATATAQEDILKDAQEAGATKEKDVGWDKELSIGGTVNLSSSNNVVGQTDGISVTLGWLIRGGIFYIEDMHDWRNTLSWSAAFSQTPQIDGFVKAADSLDFQSIYYLRLEDWIGPFFRFYLQAPVLVGQDRRAGKTTYEKVNVDGTVVETLTDRDTVHLTDPFAPLTLKQNLGLFLRPYQSDPFNLEFRVGIGANEVIAGDGKSADGNYRLGDEIDKDGDNIKETRQLIALQDSVIVGAAAGMYIDGKIDGGRIGYQGWVEALFPFYDSLADELDVLDSTNVNAGLQLSFKIFEWMSLDYQFKALLQPQVEEDWQIQNNLLLSFAYTFIKAEAAQ